MRLIFAALFLLMTSCATRVREIKDPSESMRLSRAPANLTDDWDRETLVKGLKDHIAYHKQRPGSLRFGTRRVSSAEYVAALESFLALVESERESKKWMEYLKTNFDFYEVFGKEEWGRVWITSYFNAEIPGSLTPTKELSQALYLPPEDMVVIRMNQFMERFPALQSIKSDLSEKKTGFGILRGRMSKGSQAGAVAEILPYYSREEIDSQLLLKGRNLELVYIDPIDAYFLHIQGSGIIKLPDGKMLNVGYATQNGYPYQAVGKFMFHIIPLEEMDMHKIEAHLKSLPLEEARKYMNKNPSYIFFQKNKGDSLTTLGTEVIAGRTIATDPVYFPKGTLGFLQFAQPEFAAPNELQPKSWTPTQRLIFDQDNGGAIRGPARVDLFLGRGQVAKQSAGVMKQWGKLLYLAPKTRPGLVTVK